MVLNDGNFCYEFVVFRLNFSFQNHKIGYVLAEYAAKARVVIHKTK